VRGENLLGQVHASNHASFIKYLEGT
jgi:hypothetical protein